MPQEIHPFHSLEKRRKPQPHPHKSKPHPTQKQGCMLQMKRRIRPTDTFHNYSSSSNSHCLFRVDERMRGII